MSPAPDETQGSQTQDFASTGDPRLDMDTEARKSADGTLYPPQTVKVLRDVPTGTSHHNFGVRYHYLRMGGWRGGYVQASGRSYDRQVPDTKKQLVTVGEKPVCIVYPSPASVSPAQVLEQFMTDNLYKGTLPLQPDSRTLPHLIVSVQRAQASAAARPGDAALARAEERAREDAAAVYAMVSEAERIYVERTSVGQDKDEVALDIMRMMDESREGKPTLEGGGRNAGSLLLMAQGTDTVRHYGEFTYDGSAAQLFNYYNAVKRNEGKYAGLGYTYRDYFAKAPDGAYNPPAADRVSPSSVTSTRRQQQSTQQGLADALDACVEAADAASKRNTGISGTQFLSPALLEASLKALKDDVADGRIGNNPDLYRGYNSKAADITGIMAIQDRYLGGRQPTAEESRSMEAVIRAGNAVGGTPVTAQLAADIKAAAGYITKAKLFIGAPTEAASGSAAGLPAASQQKASGPQGPTTAKTSVR